MKPYLPVLVFALLINSFLAAQESPELKVKGTGDSLDITTLEVKTVIHGYTAETTMTMTFYNDSNQTLEGELDFPLPEGAVITGFALDVEGQMIEGVVVEKQKARQTYETIVRRGIDPGLVEQTRGNNFKTRIYPILPKSSRTVALTWQSELETADSRKRYRLPLRFTAPLSRFKLHMEVVKSEAAPVLVQEARRFPGLEPWKDSYVMSYEARNIPLDESLLIEIPETGSKTVVLEEYRDGKTYFTLTADPAPVRLFGSKKQPRRLALYWDASGSRSEKDREISLDVLKRILKRYDRTWVQVDLYVFRDTVDPVRSFRVTGGTSRALESHLSRLPLDGATRWDHLPMPAESVDFALLFSDGLSSYGSPKLPDFSLPVYTFSAAVGADTASLKYIASRSGGTYTNLLSTDPETAAEQTGALRYRFLGMKLKSGSITEFYPTLKEPVTGPFNLSGILESGRAEGELLFGFGSSPVQSVPFVLEKEAGRKGNMAAIGFASRKLSELLMAGTGDQKALSDLGRHFGLVTPGTSLLVLEDPDQYFEFGIEPPLSRPDWRNEYFMLQKNRKQEEKSRLDSRLERILPLWEARVRWWETDFEYPEGFRIDSSRKKEALSEESIQMERHSEAPAESEMMAQAINEDRAGESAKMKQDGSGENSGPVITISGWNPDTPYLKRLKEAGQEELYKVYLNEKKTYGTAPSFFLDCGDYFIKSGKKSLGLRIWSNIAETGLEEPALLRILAHRLSQEREFSLSAFLFRKVKELRPEEPQSFRDLALVLADQEAYAEAVTLLWEVVKGDWDRFQEIELIALMEMNRIMARAARSGTAVPGVDSRFVKNLDTDVRIILTWDADMTDMDLWVTEPSGEKAYYGNRQTRIGGNFSRDFTQGYGPEEYLLKKAMKGPYKIEVNYFSSGAPTLSGTVTMQVDVFTDYGRRDEKKKSLTVRLSESTEVQYIGTIEF